MRFSVKVPVLSVQITVAEPSVSTEVRWRIRTFRFARRWAASTSARVNVGSRPSGTIATMMPMEKMKSRQNGTPISGTDGEKAQSDRNREHGNQPAQMRQFATQRRNAGTAGLCQMRDPAKLGMASGSEDDGVALSEYERRPGEQDVPTAQRLDLFARLQSHAPWAATPR